ncbi:hypothetical protein ACS0TY_014075 [Phlomoides rotata]
MPVLKINWFQKKSVGDDEVGVPVYAAGTEIKPAEIARQALVTTFNVEIGITGAILTKLDGDSRGGAALSVREVSGKPTKLVGRGERMEDLEPFYPDRMAGRILGMGDVLSFVEKAQEVMRQEDAEDLQKKIMSAKFDFNDFLKQTRAVARMGSMSRVIGMMPGMGKVTPAQIREAEKNLKMMESMIEVMTPVLSAMRLCQLTCKRKIAN